MTPIKALMWLLAFVFIIVAMAHVQLHADTKTCEVWETGNFTYNGPEGRHSCKSRRWCTIKKTGRFGRIDTINERQYADCVKVKT
jgi:hypothetical protein